jgi:hypothetical protein
VSRNGCCIAFFAFKPLQDIRVEANYALVHTIGLWRRVKNVVIIVGGLGYR